MTTTRHQLIDIADEWVGTVEEPPNSNRVVGVTDWYGLVGAWCAMWLSRVFYDAGMPITATTEKGFAWTPSGVSWFKKQGLWLAGGAQNEPRSGDVGFLWYQSLGRVGHTFIVEGTFRDANHRLIVRTIEGNTDEAGGRTGGKVMRRHRWAGNIYGYGLPVFDDVPEPVVNIPSGPPRPILRMGSKGKDVKDWQFALEHTTGFRLAWDGDFGRRTHVGTVNFQKFFKLAPDGIVGPKTWGVMDYVFALKG